MKKNFWLLGLAVAALTSCTQSEVVDIPQGRAIGFGTSIDKTTRAATHTGSDLTTNGINKFYVFGDFIKYSATANGNYTGEFSHLFTNDPVVNDGSGWNYVTDLVGQKYWERERVYRFAAYADGTNSDQLAATAVDYHPSNSSDSEIGDYIIFTNYEAGDKDLVAAIFGDVNTGTSLPVNDFKVDFRFRHMLSKIVFDFAMTSAPQNSNIKITDVKITNACSKGTGIMEYSDAQTYNPISWAPGEEKGGYASSDEITLSTTPEYVVFYVIPQNVTLDTNVPKNGIQLSLTVNNCDNETGEPLVEPHTYTYNLNVGTKESAAWNAGSMYHYVLRFGAESIDARPIIFGVSEVSGWTNGFSAGSITLQSSTPVNE